MDSSNTLEKKLMLLTKDNEQLVEENKRLLLIIEELKLVTNKDNSEAQEIDDDVKWGDSCSGWEKY